MNQYPDISIAQNGYVFPNFSHFPLYPNILRFLNQIFNNYLLTGFFISIVFIILGLIVFKKLVELDYSSKISKLAIIAILLYPASFQFITPNSSALFFLLTVSAFYFVRSKSWWLACILGLFASYTNFLGVFLLPAFFVEWWGYDRKSKNLIPLLLIPMGLFTYMWYLSQTTGNPIAFYVQAQDKLVLIYQVFWRYLKMLATVDFRSQVYLSIIFEFISATVFTILVIYSFIKQRLSYSLFNLCIFLFSTFSGTFNLLPKYILFCFPSFILIAEYLHEKQTS